MFAFCSALAHICGRRSVKLFLSLKPNNIACGKNQGVCKRWKLEIRARSTAWIQKIRCRGWQFFESKKKTPPSFQTSQAHSRWMNMDYPLSYAQLGGQEICRMKMNDPKWGIKSHRVALWLYYLPGTAKLFFFVGSISQKCSWKGAFNDWMFKLCANLSMYCTLLYKAVALTPQPKMLQSVPQEPQK